MDLPPHHLNDEGVGESIDSQQSEVHKGAAMEKMTKLAQKIYDTTPGINDCKLKIKEVP